MTLPVAGWSLQKIGDLINLNLKNSCEDQTTVGFVPMPLLGTSYRSSVAFEERRWSDVKKGYTHFADGDVLLAKITPCFENGKIGIPRGLPNGIGAGSTEYFVCRPKPEVLEPRYLAGWFMTESFLRNGAVEMTGSVGHKRVPKEYLLSNEIPLAPLPEQKRIVDKLDLLLARVDACRDRVGRVGPLLKRFRHSVLAAATSGGLTEDWRTKMSMSENWKLVRLAELGELGRGKSKHRPRNDPCLYGGPYPFIQTGAIAQSKGRITQHSQTYSEFGLTQSKLWPTGTVCITIAANIADTAILTYPACFPDSVVGFVADPAKSCPEFVKWSIDVISDHLESFAPATAQKNINLAILNDVEFRCPPIEEQAEIVRRVDVLFAFADRLEARLSQAQTAVGRLTPALLAKAFRGELVPQDPNDEPAAELLKRLQAARADVAKGSTPMRRVRAKATTVAKGGSQADEVLEEGAMEG
ncbi:restriction endonuclease subunit S [Cupriavidus sp. KB_39]|uniref:restriction endonuclease subunit S n=1 Tax=Cupriavidus sp. KB_39 TaxID=3233036 RepID=UPI003F8ED1DF